MLYGLLAINRYRKVWHTTRKQDWGSQHVINLLKGLSFPRVLCDPPWESSVTVNPPHAVSSDTRSRMGEGRRRCRRAAWDEDGEGYIKCISRSCLNPNPYSNILHMSQGSILSSSKGLWHTWYSVSSGEGAAVRQYRKQLLRIFGPELIPAN